MATVVNSVGLSVRLVAMLSIVEVEFVGVSGRWS